MPDEPETPQTPEEPRTPEESAPAAEEPTARESSAVEPVAETPAAEEPAPEPIAEPVAEEPSVAEPAAAEPVAAEATAAEPVAAEATAAEPAEATAAEAAAAEPAAAAEAEAEEEGEEEEPTPRVKPSVPGAHLEVDIVPEGVDPLGRNEPSDPYATSYDEESSEESEQGEDEEVSSEPISTAAIDLAANARYRATGKRKTAIARVILRPGSGVYTVNGRTLDEHFPRVTLQRNIRQPLETVGYQDRMDVVARLHGGGISAQAGALRHGISRALLEADPNLRGELKKRGFLTRDSRAKERKKAGLKKARKRPQFSKR
jgi:small subunit ribosomal protein S9